MGERAGRFQETYRHRFIHALLTPHKEPQTGRARREEKYIQAIVSAYDYVRLHPDMANGRANLIGYTQSILAMGEKEGFAPDKLMNKVRELYITWRS